MPGFRNCEEISFPRMVNNLTSDSRFIFIIIIFGVEKTSICGWEDTALKFPLIDFASCHPLGWFWAKVTVLHAATAKLINKNILRKVFNINFRNDINFVSI